MRFLAPMLLIALLALPQAANADPDERPNILFLMADDQSWNGLAVAMHPELDYARDPRVETPHLDKLASQGMRFSAAYAPAPVCAPTRIALQTGRSPAALHWTRAGPSVRPNANTKLLGPSNIRALPEEATTVGEMLQAAGYATAHFGKWHLQGGGPRSHGYDAHDGDLGNEHAAKFKDPNPVDIFGMTERAVAFMQKSKAAKKPFFVQMSWHALHAPENALAATMAKYRKVLRGGRDRQVGRLALTEDLDTGVGRLLAALDELDLAKSTYVIYTSDNGGGGGKARGGRRNSRRPTRLNGGKGSLYEGGIRVPFIVRGPGVAANAWCHVPVTLVDLLPTYAAWAGVRKLPEQLEGGSIAELIEGKDTSTVKRARKPLFFHFPHYVGQGGPQSAVRLGDHKLLTFYEDDRVALFDLSTDPREQNDLSKAQPERTATLRALLEAYLQDVKAQLPAANPRYDPSRPQQLPERKPRSGGRTGRRDG